MNAREEARKLLAEVSPGPWLGFEGGPAVTAQTGFVRLMHALAEVNPPDLTVHHEVRDDLTYTAARIFDRASFDRLVNMLDLTVKRDVDRMDGREFASATGDGFSITWEGQS